MNLVGSVLDQNYEICQEIGEGGNRKGVPGLAPQTEEEGSSEKDKG